MSRLSLAPPGRYLLAAAYIAGRRDGRAIADGKQAAIERAVKAERDKREVAVATGEADSVIAVASGGQAFNSGGIAFTITSTSATKVGDQFVGCESTCW